MPEMFRGAGRIYVPKNIGRWYERREVFSSSYHLPEICLLGVVEAVSSTRSRPSARGD